MAHSNSTQYYNLPQFDSTDKPAWLVDVNPAYAAIDAGIHAAKAAADDAQSDATQALSDASSAGTTASGADAKATGSIASLADTFDTTATYNVGDLVIYNNLLYICIVDVTVPGAWTGSGNWNRTTLETEINKKQDTLTEGTGIDITSNEVSLDINGLSSASTLTGTDEIAVYDGTGEKKTTAAAVAGLVLPSSSVPITKVNFSTNGSEVMRVGNLVFISINVQNSSAYASWTECLNFEGVINAASGFYGAVTSDNISKSTYAQAYQDGSTIRVRLNQTEANVLYRGQLVIPVT